MLQIRLPDGSGVLEEEAVEHGCPLLYWSSGRDNIQSGIEYLRHLDYGKALSRENFPCPTSTARICAFSSFSRKMLPRRWPPSRSGCICPPMPAGIGSSAWKTPASSASASHSS